jgi:RES domain-containing protein
VGLFDELVDADELDLLYELENQTNDRLESELGYLSLVPPVDRLVGPGTTPIMAAFTHPNPEGSRFSNGEFGVYYCAKTIDTAIHESAHHRARFLQLTKEPPCHVEMRLYIAELQKDVHDGLDGRLSGKVMDPDNYTHSQALAVSLRDQGSYGLSYPSVRDPGGKCVVIFRPPAIGPVRQSKHFEYVYDGSRISAVIELGDFKRL